MAEFFVLDNKNANNGCHGISSYHNRHNDELSLHTSEAAIPNEDMAIASVYTVGSKSQKAELVDGLLVCHVSVRQAVRLIMTLQPYRAADGKIQGPM